MSNRRIYLLNEEFLDKWSPKMAYVLGFWFADGYMRHEKSYRVVFSSGDYQSLLDIRKCLESNHRIIERNDRDFQLIIFSKKLYLRLLNLGGKRRKSRDIKFPKVPLKYLSDFIRGYFDGDGSVFYTTYRSTKNKKMRTELRSNFTSGSPKFLDVLQTVLVDIIGVSRKKLCSFNEGSSWKLGYATMDTVKLLKFMYYSGYPIALERKASFAKDIFTKRNFICRGVGIRFTGAI
ncbi:MAG: hypothetical protein ABH956_03415 [Candidatus Nealsonbacteria bacterium]